MTDFCVLSTATGLADGTSWDDAYTLIETALSGKATTDRILVSHNHAGSKAGPSLVYTCPTSPGLQILGVTQSGLGSSQDFSGLVSTVTASEITTTASDPVDFNGFAYVYGIEFQPGPSGGGAELRLGSSATLASGLVFEFCILNNRGNNAATELILGPAIGGATKDIYVELIDCEARFGAVGQTFMFRSGRFRVRNLSLGGATVPTNLFDCAASGFGDVEVWGSDLTGLNITGALMVYATNYSGFINFHDLKIPASMSLASGSIDDPALLVQYRNISNAGAVYEFFRDSFAGTVEDDTSVTRTASDGTTAISHLYKPSANTSYEHPLYGPRISAWHDTTASVTFTVHCLINSATTFTADEIGVDFEHLQSGPNTAFVTTNDGDIVTAGSTLTDSNDEANWAGESATNLQTFDFSITVTPGQKGPIYARPWMRVPTGTLTQAYFSAKIVES